MAKALICDRCGSVYKIPENYNPRYLVFDLRGKDEDSWSEFRGTGRPIDLCLFCSGKLRAFINDNADIIDSGNYNIPTEPL